MTRTGTRQMAAGADLAVSALKTSGHDHVLTLSFPVASDIQASNLEMEGMRGGAFTISQCTRFSGAPGTGNCTNSQFQIRNLEVRNVRGTTKSKNVASFQCSAVAPCTDIGLYDIDVRFTNGTAAPGYLCGNVVNPEGFECTGPPCVGGSATGGC